MNVRSIDAAKMLAAKVGDVFSGDPYETSLPVVGNRDEPLLDFLRESLTRTGEEDEDPLDEIEQEDWKPEAVTWATTL